MSDHIEHTGDDGSCWCAGDPERARALDRLYPDRCQIPNSEDGPCAGERHCVLVAGHKGGCRGSLERPGGPCHFCGQTWDLATSDWCPRCWQSFEGMNVADIKAVFAAGAPELSVDP